jgi:hypothetical protein
MSETPDPEVPGAPVPEAELDDPATTNANSAAFVSAPLDSRSATTAIATDEPADLPAPVTATIADLKAAVSAPESTAPTSTSAIGRTRNPRPATDDDHDRPRLRRSRWPLRLAAIATVVTVIAVVIVLGRVNAQNYAIRCGTKDITALRGRAFPPWGYARLGGPAWRPIAIAPDTECTSRDTDSVEQLEATFLEHLTEQATRKLAGEQPGDLDRAEAEIDQALLLSRSPERRDLRKELERLRGDITYWRAAAKVNAAAAILADAATSFDAATAQRPRHASDPARWASFARDLAAALRAGPDGAGVPSPRDAIAPPRPSAPPGVALPIESPAIMVDGGMAPEADAGRRDLPSGGVLM